MGAVRCLLFGGVLAGLAVGQRRQRLIFFPIARREGSTLERQIVGKSCKHTASVRSSRPFVVTLYVPAAGKDNPQPSLPSQGPCFREGGPPCRLGVHHQRFRKTGPGFPLTVMRCATHKLTSAKPGSIRMFSKVVPERQVEMVELMKIANNYSPAYAKSLYAGTPREQLAAPEREKKVKGLKADDLSAIEKEMQEIGKAVVTIDETYSRNVLNLVLTTGYLKKILGNERVIRFLSRNHSDTLTLFTGIIEAGSLEA